jgi:hypothetical protein
MTSAVLTIRRAAAPSRSGRGRCACGGVIGPTGKCDRCAALEALRSPGEPLDDATRAVMETRFRHDFSKVRIHSGAQAAESASTLDAASYTVGSSIVMGAGRYAPGTASGQRLLAHELAHVVQAPEAPSQVDALEVSEPGDPDERDAERAADTALRPARGPAIRRQAEEAEPTGAKKAPSEEELRSLASRPSLAIQRWPTLDQGSQSFVLFVMAGRYGPDFAADFFDYATGKKKPDLSSTISNSPSDSPQALQARGDRLCCTPGGIPVYVHPSGHEVHRLSNPMPSEPPEDRCEKQREHCLLDTDDEDACHKCCDDTISPSDQKCLRGCHFACSLKL